jgi:hypothetical protein
MQQPRASATSDASFSRIERETVQAAGQSLTLCTCCQRTMKLRALRDYGLPNDLPRRMTRVAWWACACGHREVLTQTVLS